MVELMKKAIKKGDEKNEDLIYEMCLKNKKYINNWDLVGVSARDIVGRYLLNRGRSVLYDLTKGKSKWDRRIAIISTWAFIKNGECEDTFSICEMLLNYKSDLIHKACGWMLREVEKNCDIEVLSSFLRKHARTMPRTMLRYALEKYDKAERKKYTSLLGRP